MMRVNPFTIGNKVRSHNSVAPRRQWKLHRFCKELYTVVDVRADCLYKINKMHPLISIIQCILIG